LIGALRHRLPRAVLVSAAFALLVANTINIGADLSAMADAAELFSGLSSHVWVVLFGAGIAWATIRMRYATIASALKWLTLTLFAYIACALYVGPDWGAVLRALVPKLPQGSAMWGAVVAILGTTISPYLFFWQASQEVEEERAKGRGTVEQRRGASSEEFHRRKVDVATGTFVSNLVMFFIMLTTALTLHAQGVTGIGSSREATEALQPIAGRFAAGLYALAIIGVGLLAVPTLSGSAAYALAEAFDWRDGLDRKLREAPAFYGVVALASLGGIAMDVLDLNPIRALYWSAVINGVLAPFLLIGVLWVASDSQLMAKQPSSGWSRALVLLTILCMLGAMVGMFAL
jgi:Mn2+/Fe2+ NRAMP family transporter